MTGIEGNPPNTTEEKTEYGQRSQDSHQSSNEANIELADEAAADQRTTDMNQVDITGLNEKLAPQLGLIMEEKPSDPTTGTEFRAFLLSQVLDILKIFVRIMKFPIILMLVAYTVNTMAYYAPPNAIPVVTRGIAQLCVIPGVSAMPICSIKTAENSPRKSEFADIVDIQMGMEVALKSAGASHGVAMKVMQTGFAVRGLRKHIKRSNLPYREDLISKLNLIEEGASISSEKLSTLEAEVSSAFNTFLAIDKRAIKTLERIQQSTQSVTLFSRLFSGSSVSKTSEQELVKMYNQAATKMEKRLDKIIETTSNTRTEIHRLGTHLDALEEVVVNSQEYVKDQKEEVLAKIWTKVGGNSDDIADYNEKLDLLSKTNAYQRTAADLVGNTLGQLQTLKAGISKLTEEVSFDGEADSLEEHIDALRMGVVKLLEAEASAKRSNMGTVGEFR